MHGHADKCHVDEDDGCGDAWREQQPSDGEYDKACVTRCNDDGGGCDEDNVDEIER